jgi:hypothetical protein
MDGKPSCGKSPMRFSVCRVPRDLDARLRSRCAMKASARRSLGTVMALVVGIAGVRARQFNLAPPCEERGESAQNNTLGLGCCAALVTVSPVANYTYTTLNVSVSLRLR